MKRILNKEKNDTDEHPNPRLKTAIYLSCVATFCIFLILILVSKNVIIQPIYYVNVIHIIILNV